MRPITTHATNPANEVVHLAALDGPGPGGASHVYQITLATLTNKAGPMVRHGLQRQYVLQFQDGPVQEDGNGVNGLTHEVLLAVLIDRLEGFQAGKYANAYNASALTHLQLALGAFQARTRDREARGVEGTHQV